MNVDLLKSQNNQNISNMRQNVQFSGKFNWNKAGEEVSKKSKFIPRTLTYLGQNDGEILNTVVTAGGTSIVAPIFIAGNPFSKEDKETKWYSAMRQPISAVIAFVFQMYINNKFNDWMAKQASTGRFGKTYDLSAMPKANYVKKIVKLEHPEFTSKEIDAEILKRQMYAERIAVGKARQELRNKKVDIKELVSKDALDEAKKMLTKEIKEKYKDELNGKNALSIEKFVETKLNDKLIEERAISNIQNSIATEAKAKFKVRELADKFSNIDDAIKHMSEQKFKNKGEESLIKNIIERLETTKLYEESKGLPAFSSLKDLGKTYDSVLHNVEIKRLVKAKASDAQKAFGKLNKWAGIFVSLATLPFSCGLLNWSYPRIMEKVMPKLQPWIHRNDKDWSPENAKKYGPSADANKTEVKVENEKEDDDE